MRKDRKLLKFGIYTLAFITSLIYYHFKDTKNDEVLAGLFQNTIFGIEGVKTELKYHSVQQQSMAIKIEAIGLPEKASYYKPVILAFVCSTPILRRQLDVGKTINFDMAAPDRQDGYHTNLSIDSARCGKQ